MKNKLAIAAALAAAYGVSQAEIPLTDNLSIQGFVDMSAVYSDGEVDGDDFESDSFSLDQVEVDFLFDFDDVTGRIDIESLAGNTVGDAADLSVERAELNYMLPDDGGMVTGGRLQSLLGFEAFEPTGLYQYSFAYSALGGNLASGYADGVRYTYEAESAFFAASVQDSVSGDDGTLGDNIGFEAATGYSADGLTLFLGGYYEEADDDVIGTSDSYWVNSYASYEQGPWVSAIELNYGEIEDNLEEFSGLIMANYAYDDFGSFTGRISYLNREFDLGGEDDGWTFTLAHGYALGDHILLVQEVSYTDAESGGLDGERLDLAAEAIFVF
jgi:hypothetical protein